MIDVFVQGVKIDLVSGKAAYAFVRGGKPYFPVVCLRDSGDVSNWKSAVTALKLQASMVYIMMVRIWAKQQTCL